MEAARLRPLTPRIPALRGDGGNGHGPDPRLPPPRPALADGGDQRHSDGRRHAGPADHLHGDRAPARRRGAGRPARQQGRSARPGAQARADLARGGRRHLSSTSSRSRPPSSARASPASPPSSREPGGPRIFLRADRVARLRPGDGGDGRDQRRRPAQGRPGQHPGARAADGPGAKPPASESPRRGMSPCSPRCRSASPPPGCRCRRAIRSKSRSSTRSASKARPRRPRRRGRRRSPGRGRASRAGHAGAARDRSRPRRGPSRGPAAARAGAEPAAPAPRPSQRRRLPRRPPQPAPAATRGEPRRAEQRRRRAQRPPNPSQSTAPPAAAAGAAVQASLGAEVRRQLKPHWKAPTGADAEQLRTEVVIALAEDGRVDRRPDRRHQRPDREQPAAGPAPPGAGRRAPSVSLRPSGFPPNITRRGSQLRVTFDKRLRNDEAPVPARPVRCSRCPPPPSSASTSPTKAATISSSPSRSCRPRRRADTPAGSTEALGRQVAEVVAADLRGSGLFRPVGPAGVRAVPFAEVTAPGLCRMERRRRRRARPGLRPRQSGRAAHRRLLSLRRRAAVRADPPGLCRRSARLAPRRPQMRRRHLFAPVRREPLLRQPHRLYRRERAQGARGSSGSRSWIRTAPTTAS